MVIILNHKKPSIDDHFLDLALMLRSNFNNQHNSEDTIGLNNGVLVIQKKVKNLHAINTINEPNSLFTDSPSINLRQLIAG
jgi:hypothetical protein